MRLRAPSSAPGRVAPRREMRRVTALFHADAYIPRDEGRDAEINLITKRVSIAVTVSSG